MDIDKDEATLAGLQSCMTPGDFQYQQNPNFTKSPCPLAASLERQTGERTKRSERDDEMLPEYEKSRLLKNLREVESPEQVYEGQQQPTHQN